MWITPKKIDKKAGEEILKTYQRVKEDNNDFSWEYISFTTVRGMSIKFELAINKESKVYRMLTMHEAVAVNGAHID